MDELNVITDADLINQYSRSLTEEPAPQITTQAPSSSEVHLLVGVEIDGTVETSAEVRELNGEDEEIIAKAGSLGKALNLILTRGVVSIGEHRATEEVLDALLAGDRDLLMLAIRQVTFEQSLTISTGCYSCGTSVELELDIDKDVPSVPASGAQRWSIDTKLGLLNVGFYNGRTQKRLMDNLEKTSAELSTIVLSGCINSLDGAPVIASEVAKKLGMGDRQKVLGEILDKAPGPRLSEVKSACTACGTELLVPLSLASLFRI